MADQRKPVQLGCIYLVWLGIVFSALLVINIVVVGAVVGWFADRYPAFSNQQKIQQIIQFVVPIVVIFIEFWIFDYIRDRLDRRAESSKSSGKTTSS